MIETLQLHWSSSACTHVGKIREYNEDAYLEDPKGMMWAVADGMGGHAVGDVASNMIVDSLSRIPTSASLDMYINDVIQRLQEVNNQLRVEAIKRREQVIGSTVVVLLGFEHQCACLWAGDSRIYRSREGKLEQLTRDHSQIEELIAHGIIDRSQAGNHPASNAITRAVGAADKLVIDVALHEVKDGDIFLLCSDGLTNEVEDNEIARELVRGDCQKSSNSLLQQALDHGARDNVTVLVVQVEDTVQSTKTIMNPLTTI